MHTLSEGVENARKAYGERAAGKGSDYPEFIRLPTGIFPLDLALGGGFPVGAVSIIYGPEGSGKTSLAYRIVAQFQKRYGPDLKAAWIDAENQHDPKWAKLHGVDDDALALFKPTTAEEAADDANEAVFSSDCGLLVVDSIAALAAFDELDKEAEKVVMAGNARPSTRLMKKVGGGMVEHVKAGVPLTVIYINQVRNKIGFVLGNPEILPGPWFQNYQAFLKLRLTAKPILKEKVAAVPIYSENTAKITKKKFPAIRQSCTWNTILYPHDDWKPLDVNNHKFMEQTLEDLGYLEQDGKKWLLYGEVFDTKKAAVQQALSDYDDTVKQVVEDLLLLYKEEIY